MAFLDPILNPILQPLLDFSPFWAIIILAFIITLIITFAYKVFTDQKEMKRLKDKQKDYQKQMKSMRDNPQEMMKMQKEAMKLNMEYMKHSFKVTIITFIPIILIFGWMNVHLAYEPIMPGETFSVSAFFKEGFNGEAELIFEEGMRFGIDPGTAKTSLAKQTITEENKWYLTSLEGEYFVTIKVNDVEQSKKILVTKNFITEEALAVFKDSVIEQIKINYKAIKPIDGLLSTGEKEADFSIFGWKPGWLGLYIILSIVFSLVLRKVLKIY